MFVGLTHTGILVQAGQLSALGRALAQDHHDFLEVVIQEECLQHPDSSIIEGVRQSTVYSHPESFLSVSIHYSPGLFPEV